MSTTGLSSKSVLFSLGGISAGSGLPVSGFCWGREANSDHCKRFKLHLTKPGSLGCVCCYHATKRTTQVGHCCPATIQGTLVSRALFIPTKLL